MNILNFSLVRCLGRRDPLQARPPDAAPFFAKDWVLLNIMIFVFAGTNLAGCAHFRSDPVL